MNLFGFRSSSKDVEKGVATTPEIDGDNESGGTPLIEQEDIATRQSSQVEPLATRFKTVGQYPNGYPRLAAVLDSDENFMIYRRFGVLQARLLLYKQDELRELEETLEKMDEKDEQNFPDYLGSRDIQNRGDGSHKKLMYEIEDKFKAYAQLLTTARDITTLDPPSASDFKSVKNYFDRDAPVCAEEAHICHKGDLVALKPEGEHSCIDSMLEKILQKAADTRIHYFFTTKHRAKAGSKDSGLVLYNNRRVNTVVSIIITAVVVGILMVPICILWEFNRGKGSKRAAAWPIPTIFGFTLAFSGVLCLCTKAKRHEILGLAAAYCAVLVVFIGGQDSASSGS